jgi:hypothetical protein
VASDLVSNLFNRLGAAGLALIVGALLFGALLGATATHRADQIAAQNAAARQGEDSNNQAQSKSQAQQGQNDEQGSKSANTKKTPKQPTKKKTPSDSD